MIHLLLRKIIRESLLLEEVYGAQTIVYHGMRARPEEMVQALIEKDRYKIREK